MTKLDGRTFKFFHLCKLLLYIDTSKFPQCGNFNLKLAVFLQLQDLPLLMYRLIYSAWLQVLCLSRLVTEPVRCVFLMETFRVPGELVPKRNCFTFESPSVHECLVLFFFLLYLVSFIFRAVFGLQRRQCCVRPFILHTSTQECV